jgi:hypothetical protein
MEEQMLSSFARTLLAAAALTMSSFSSAESAENAKIDKLTFAIKVPYESDINVTSSTGKRWDAIVSQALPLWADILVDTKHPGYVERAGIFFGLCSGSACGESPRLAFWAPMSRDWRFNDYFDLETSKMPGEVRAQLIDGCNARIQQPEGTSEPHDFSVTVFASLSVNTRKAHGYASDVENLPWGVDSEGETYRPASA